MMRLRSVELEMPQADAAAKFLTDTWGLLAAGSRGKSAFLRGTADHGYIISVTEAPAMAVASVTFSGSSEEVQGVAQRAKAAGVVHQAMKTFERGNAAPLKHLPQGLQQGRVAGDKQDDPPHMVAKNSIILGRKLRKSRP